MTRRRYGPDQSGHSRGSSEGSEDWSEKGSMSSKSDRYERENEDKPFYGSKPSPYSESPRELERSNRDRRMPHSDYPGPHSSTDVTFLNAKSLTMSALPKIGYTEDFDAPISAIHSHLTFCANMAPWTSFEQEVRDNFNRLFRDWDQEPKNILSVESKQSPANAIINEHHLCGEGISTSSVLYVQNVLDVMTAVGKELHIGVKFGDWYASHKHPTKPSTSQTTTGTAGNQSEKKHNEIMRKRLAPDYALLAEEEDPETGSFARALGEVKSPSSGVNYFYLWVDLAKSAKEEVRLRKLLGWSQHSTQFNTDQY
ncbi:hypothetical protein DTO271G3_871 [Paecilomyces variotii]|nr:hypothetical protein DTO271G3_871 [Paecilomyces variotii]